MDIYEEKPRNPCGSTHTHTHTDIRLINRFENNSCKFWGARIICIAQSLIRDG